MDVSSEPLEAPPQLLTQDDLPPELNGDLTMRSVLNTFVIPEDMSPSASAQFVTHVLLTRHIKNTFISNLRLVRCYFIVTE